MKGFLRVDESDGFDSSDDNGVFGVSSPTGTAYDRSTPRPPSTTHHTDTISHHGLDELSALVEEISCPNTKTPFSVTDSSSNDEVGGAKGTLLKYGKSNSGHKADKTLSDEHASINAPETNAVLQGVVEFPDTEEHNSFWVNGFNNSKDQKKLKDVSEGRLMISSTPFDGTVGVEDPQESPLSGYERFLTYDTTPQKQGVEEKRDVVTIDRIIHCMRSNFDKPDTLQEQIRALQNLCIGDETRDRIGICGGILISVGLIKLHAKNENLLKQILFFLSDLCQTSQRNKLQLGQCHGLQVIVNVLQDCRSTSSDLTKRACAVLRISCISCPFNTTLAGKCGAIQAVLTVLRQRKGGISLQEECLRALFYFTHEHPPNISALEEYGGPEEIIAACGHYSFDANFQATTFNLTHSLVRQSPRLRISLFLAGLIDEISSTLPLMHSCKPFIMACAGTLRFLAFHGVIRRAICLTTIIETLTTSLSHHQSEASIIQPLLVALGNITYDLAVSKKRACSRKALTALHNILANHATHASIIAQCLRLLRNISDGPLSTRRTCLQCNTPRFITQAMQTLPGAVAVQEHGAAALINLTRIDAEHVRSSALEDHIERVIALHADSTAAHKQLVFLREALGSQVKGLAKLFSRGGVSVSRLSSTATASEVDCVLRDTTVANALAALASDMDAIEY